MPTPNDITTINDGDTLREVLIARMAYCLEENEDPEDFVALDATSGSLCPALLWHETVFWIDPDDTTTAHDGITTLVTSDGYRYKASDLDLRIVSVLERDLADPPDGSPGPAFGDTYLVPAGATGDWSANADYIAIYTARGWAFRAPKVGMWLYVEEEDLFVRYDADGDWVEGPGAPSDAPDSIPLSAIINAGRFVIVENQTTNSPPSAAQGVAYIIGSSPTGAWSGHAGKVAIRESSGTSTDYTIYSPPEGMRAYDKTLNRDYQYTGSAWQSATGATRTKIAVFAASGTFAKDARCIEAKVIVIGSGGSASDGGGNSSFGSHCTGGAAQSGAAGGAGGTASGGDLNLSGASGLLFASDPSGEAQAGFRLGAYGTGGPASAGSRGGGGAGAAVKTILAASLATNETVTINNSGAANGLVYIEETIEV